MWSKPPKRATDLPNVKGQSNTRVLRSRVEKPAPTVQRKARAARPRDRNGDPKFANLGGDKQRPNVGSGKHLEKFWHVERRAGETLPPRGCLWREKRTNENLITYTLVHAKLTGYVPISPDSPQENYPHLSRLIIPPAKGASSGMKEFVSEPLTQRPRVPRYSADICRKDIFKSWSLFVWGMSWVDSIIFSTK